VKHIASVPASTAVLVMLLLTASCAGLKPGSPVDRRAAPGPASCEVPWSYSGERRPDLWDRLSPCYAGCATGGEQSPADLTVAVFANNLPELTFLYSRTAKLGVVNDGHTIKAYAPSGSKFMIGGKEFNLEEFHFHTLSEHRLNGRQTPLELHLVNKNAGGAAAVGVFIVPDPGNRENRELAKIWSRLERYTRTPTEVADFDIMALLPTDRSSFRYAGSLTTPSCGQDLQWTVLATPITASREQIERFERLLAPAGNSRPLQPLNRRTVLRDFQ
jgi:carbonic anhydrase